MELNLYWTVVAKNELQNIFSYYKEKANSGVAKKLTSGIVHETLRLKTEPRIGQIEELLSKHAQEYRYLVYKNYKIIYWINEKKNRIEIADVFDTRQNPVKINRSE
ncbi:type II toxin-antitoxin system RelE/ParE family toxin [Mucilaginibacter arboris]|uniref:Type II toxin-antitoxin system RelE/ParE family toxin n=1 Tax=Mucilaginibacter arboris TaxID=2682090 RepID=A0A7K1SS13_9SPHI|nr:type II toxin-antitoxin system RelE/ParE family toxin [Mucilaginibacter arboris]MVN20106.1 type II toxin-antitoxin system RelE/ParE family toxin [Mucilaginibacter arboris]